MKINYRIITLLIIAASTIFGFAMYSRIPEMMASHWNIKGQVDGYMPKLFGILLLPVISLALLWFFKFASQTDPIRKTDESYKKQMDKFILVFISFLSYIYIISILYSIGIKLNIAELVPPALGILFFYIGTVLKHVQPNWFLGIRTPWTLSNDSVWYKTHKVVSKLFVILGVTLMAGFFFPEFAFFILFAGIILVSVFSIFYSYYLHKTL